MVVTSEEMFTVREVASRLKVSEQTIRRMIKGGSIQVIRIRGQIRIPKEEVDKLISREQ